MRLLPRDERFFELFAQLADHCAVAAVHLNALVTGPVAERADAVRAIKAVEHQADEVTHGIVRRLDRAFITPFDREDIHMLASRLDDVVDRVDSCARRFQIFRVDDIPEGARLMADVIQRVGVELVRAVGALEKGPPLTVLTACREIKRLEEEGDAIYHTWLGKLFEDHADPLMVIKWKELYDTLEKTLDSADDAANVLESVTIKHG